MAMSPWVTWPALTKFGSLGVMVALLVLAAERQELLENNMFDTEDWQEKNADIVCDERSLTARMEDGTCNILENPAEGSVHVNFGRNVDPSAVYAETNSGNLLNPNPREVSNLIMSRGGDFKPATTLNFIATSWIQFMVHDWFDHGPRTDANPIEFPLPAGDVLGGGTMSVQRTRPDPDVSGDEGIITYENINTHWWDGSQLYGSSKEKNDEVRSFVDGKLEVDGDGRLPTEFFSGKPVTGFNENWWVGLSMLHHIFTQEHNAIADMLVANYPGQTDQWYFDKARLINSALMAKIHTVEWTPAILANPVLERAMYANWWGLGGDRDKRDKYQDDLDMLNNNLGEIGGLLDLVGINNDLGDNPTGSLEHALAGLVGSRTPNNYNVPYTLTEEFVSVYRMHPLLRDEIKVYDIGSNVVDQEIALEDTRNGNAEDLLGDLGQDRLWYSFGITHPGALSLNNYPDFLRNLSMPLIGDIDMAAIDILRDRERGVPRYNEFRRQIGLKPLTSFEQLTSDPQLLADLKALYNNDIELVDTLVGQLGEETRPEGFGFGETSFQIFILNASRRLMTDRFFTTDYTDEVYTAEGIDWVEENTMVDVIRRHFPSLATSLVGMDNAFKPWGLNMPEEYQDWDAQTKQNHLWVNGALRTSYNEGEVPAIEPIDIGGLIDSILWKKVQDVTDVAPPGYSKPIHPRGGLAKVKFVPSAGHDFTGLFQGADHGLLRLSVTGDPSDRGFAPGLALKLFVDGKRSENVSALYTLSGQGSNHNIFANELSNYVQAEVNETLGTTTLFSLVSTKPTLLVMSDMAKVNQDGSAVGSPKTPSQIYFVPNSTLRNNITTGAHDFRDDLTAIPAGTKVYDIYGTTQSIKTSIWPWVTARYARERRESAVKIGELVTDSEFTLSQFGDTGIFFKHQRYEDR
ncbi:peroxidase [Alcanivorax sp. S6407]|uniref:peroxidase family protein n=1 Tax=Alcanivorax sp. S6407 TaxID=2926424 RepID=UPI001FF5F5E8|nr:peroxidase family protein [Alcanivorax sp. S6407]MCK0153467.1 peroxidase [Alcanivorax sp. S6407]